MKKDSVTLISGKVELCLHFGSNDRIETSKNLFNKLSYIKFQIHEKPNFKTHSYLFRIVICCSSSSFFQFIFNRLKSNMNKFWFIVKAYAYIVYDIRKRKNKTESIRNCRHFPENKHSLNPPKTLLVNLRLTEIKCDSNEKPKAQSDNYGYLKLHIFYIKSKNLLNFYFKTYL